MITAAFSNSSSIRIKYQVSIDHCNRAPKLQQSQYSYVPGTIFGFEVRQHRTRLGVSASFSRRRRSAVRVRPQSAHGMGVLVDGRMGEASARTTVFAGEWRR